jgi:PAS domain S-box-containing protein
LTPNKPIEEQLNECEKKFLNALQECPLAVTLTSAIDHRYIEVNKTFERITGWQRNEILGRTPFDIDIWVDPRDRLDFVKRLLSGDSVKNLEVHARLKNREVWVGLGFAALIEINGETCVLSLIEGITDSKKADETKQAEVTISTMVRSLIQAQDKERVSVARDLHTYIDRLLLLSANLGVRQRDSEPLTETNQHISEARRQIEDLVLDIQDLSQRLHSSKVEYLGLSGAAAALCKEWSDKKKVKIQFATQGIPREMPQDVSLCLFRVLQGALQNALSHSDSQLIEVSLSGEANEVYLTVRDSGVVFDVDDAATPPIGLAILKERLKLVGGELHVQSQRGRGTTLQAHVPLRVKSRSVEGATG